MTLKFDYYIITKKTNEVIEVKETSSNGAFYIKHFICKNSENFFLKSNVCNLKVNLSVFDINGSTYVNINSEHIIEYFKFIKITRVYNTVTCCKDSTCIVIHGNNMSYTVHDCNVELFRKGLQCVSNVIKSKSFWF